MLILLVLTLVPLAGSLQQLSFSVLERGASGARGGLEIVGPRWMRRPTQRARGEERLYRRLAAAQQRHQELDAQIARCQPKTVAWRSLEHADLKRRKLRCRDECEVLAAQLRQSRRCPSGSVLPKPLPSFDLQGWMEWLFSRACWRR